MLMGILNMTPDSFSDGGKFNINSKAFRRISEMINSGADIVDIGGESTRPGSKIIYPKIEWERVEEVIKKFKKKFPKTLLSVDTRKSLVMEKAIKSKVDIINDVSCYKFDKKSYNTVINKNLWKIIHHMQGTPQTMQINPKYNHVLLDIYDFFEKEIKKFKKDKFHKKIILDPGIGFGKNLKHNLMILNKISIFHSLGFPVLIGTSRKRFINEISKNFDTKERLGGTLSSVLYSLSQGVQIFRIHDVGEIKQGILVFETLLNK
jgi:dihydropteroate synthase